jgi:hypothetical protein
MSAPAWERIFSFPRAGVGTHSRHANIVGHKPAKTGRLPESVPTPARWEPEKDGTLTRIGSHAGAWEPEKTGRFCYPNRFPRRRVGTRKTHIKEVKFLINYSPIPNALLQVIDVQYLNKRLIVA